MSNLDYLPEIDDQINTIREIYDDPAGVDPQIAYHAVDQAQLLFRRMDPCPPMPEFMNLSNIEVHRAFVRHVNNKDQTVLPDVETLDKRLNILDLLLAGLSDMRRFVLDGKKQPPAACVFDPERKILILKGKPIALQANEEDLIKMLIEKKATTLQILRRCCSNPQKVLANLQNKYPALKKFISLPGRKGQGGYSTTIELAK